MGEMVSEEKFTGWNTTTLRVAMGDFVLVRASVGDGGCNSSYAPMSQCFPDGRAWPRWSTAGQVASSPASMAGNSGRRACVWVGPPLSKSASIPAEIPDRSPRSCEVAGIVAVEVVAARIDEYGDEAIAAGVFRDQSLAAERAALL